MWRLTILFLLFLNVSQLSSQCGLFDLVVEPQACDENDMFWLDFEFQYVGVSDSFIVAGNGSSYGVFAYGEVFYTIGPLLGDCATDYELAIYDQNIEACQVAIEIGEICCGMEVCEIGELLVEVGECNDADLFNVFINFEYSGVSDSFRVVGNGNQYGHFAYGDLPVEIGPLEGNCETNYEFVVRDLETESCASDIGIGEVCCGMEVCEIGELTVEVGECTPNDIFYVSLNFEYTGVSGLFQVQGNGMVYGQYAYEQLPVELGPFEGDCEIEYEFVVVDVENEGCSSVIDIGKVCCGMEVCEIGELTVEVGECNDADLFNVFINFEYSGVSDSFRVVGNGNQYGHFAYGDLPVEIGPLDGNCETNYEFVVRDLETESCASDIGIGEVCCGMEVCEIGELLVEVGECNDAEMFNVFINFEYSGVSDSFRVVGNGNQYGHFAYGDLPVEIGPLDGNCETNYEFVVRDLETESCASDIGIGEVCCGMEVCEIGELLVEVGECTPNDIFYVSLNFEYTGVSGLFQVQGNGMVYGQYAYQQLPLELGPFEGDCEIEYEFVVVDVENEGCSSGIDIGKVCCGMEVCEIGELLVEVGGCNDAEMFNVFINFEYSGVSDSFRVVGNGNQYGHFAYGDLPVEIGPLEGNCETNYEFVVRDLETESCASDIGIGEVCCGMEVCEIGELQVEVGECTPNDIFYVSLNFEYTGVSGLFQVQGNGMVYGQYAYEQLPVELGPFEGDCEIEYEFVVVDVENEGCSSGIDIGKVCCGMEVCEIGELLVEVGECNDADMFNVFIDFEYTGVSDLFQLAGNGVVYGQFAYADLPIELGPLPGDCEKEYEFVVVDLLSEACNSSIEIGTVCCGAEDCEISNVNVATTECNDDEQFFAVILFDYQGTSENFSVLGNGNDYGTFAYDNLPIAVGPLAADCDTEYEFIIVDQSIESCVEEYVLGAICCEACEIGEIDVISTECSDAVSLLEVDFEYAGVVGLGFDVFVGDNAFGFFSYESLPLVLEIEDNELATYQITICENDMPDCCASIEVENPCFSTLVEELWVDQIKLIYDNADYLVDNKSDREISFDLFAIDGKLLYTETVGAFAQKVILTTEIPAGLYIVRFQSGMHFKVEKMIIER